MIFSIDATGAAAVILRSILYQIAFYVNFALWVIVCTPFVWLPRKWLLVPFLAWARSTRWILRVVAGVGLEVRGDPGPYDGPLLVAAKHQSMFETVALLPLFADPAFILKKELNAIPVWGWWQRRMRMIPVERTGGAKALKEMARTAKAEALSGRQILIFPEGTRRAPGDAPDYKPGAAILYQQMGVPCLPVALNSGLYWPRRSIRRYPGTIIVEILDPIEPGLPPRDFMNILQDRIEAASDRLLAEAAEGDTPPPLPETAKRRLRELESERV